MIDEDLVVNANIGAADAGPQKTSFVSLDVNPVDYNYGDSVFNPDDTVATPAIYTIYFDEEGEFSSFYSDSILVSNWVP